MTAPTIKNFECVCACVLKHVRKPMLHWVKCSLITLNTHCYGALLREYILFYSYLTHFLLLIR